MRVAPVGADHDSRPLDHCCATLAVAADADDAPSSIDDLVDREALAHLGAGLAGRVDEDLVEHRAARRVGRATPSLGRGEPAIVNGPKSNE